jgi:hypothetical protein
MLLKFGAVTPQVDPRYLSTRKSIYYTVNPLKKLSIPVTKTTVSGIGKPTQKFPSVLLRLFGGGDFLAVSEPKYF